MKRIVLVMVIALSTGFSYSQMSIGGQVTYLKAFGFGSAPGVGAKFDFAQTDRMVFTGGINYYLPITLEESTYVHASSSLTSPSSLRIASEERASFIQFQVGVRYYFTGDYESSFGFYGLAGASVLVIPWSSTITGEYDKLLYSGPADQSELMTGLTVNLGLGIEKEFDFGYIFAEAALNLKATSANGQAIEQPIPNSGALNLGLRYPF